MLCRHCGFALKHSLIDLGTSPPSNAYLAETALQCPEQYFPLRVLVCEQCWLVQTEDFAKADELFDSEYAYFSSYSSSWLDHSKAYVDEVANRFQLGAHSHVVEVAANDGYLLQYVQARRIPCTGIEPTASTAAAAREKSISIVQEFFGRELGQSLSSQGLSADWMIANNVLAHVPDINDFVSGFRELLKPQGVVTFEFPHLVPLIEECLFDTIYHEHFSYLSLTAVQSILESNGLSVFDVSKQSVHGGSLRVFAQRSVTGKQSVTPRVAELLQDEQSKGVNRLDFYSHLQAQANKIKNDLLRFLIDAANTNKSVAAYGAAAKGNTLLNYAGVRHDLIHFVVDRNPAKQGKYMPGSRIPICGESELLTRKPDYILILPWNLAAEVGQQLSYAKTWGARIARAVPTIEFLT